MGRRATETPRPTPQSAAQPAAAALEEIEDLAAARPGSLTKQVLLALPHRGWTPSKLILSWWTARRGPDPPGRKRAGVPAGTSHNGSHRDWSAGALTATAAIAALRGEGAAVSWAFAFRAAPQGDPQTNTSRMVRANVGEVAVLADTSSPRSLAGRRALALAPGSRERPTVPSLDPLPPPGPHRAAKPQHRPDGSRFAPPGRLPHQGTARHVSPRRHARVWARARRGETT